MHEIIINFQTDRNDGVYAVHALMGPFPLGVLSDRINNILLQLEGCDPKRFSGLADLLFVLQIFVFSNSHATKTHP
jgi:hypothetical protein